MLRSRLLTALVVAGGLALSGCTYSAEQQADLPHTYLEHALQAVQAHDAAKALADLNQAENAWLGRNVPFTDPFFNFDPDAMREIARARQSVELKRWGDAEYYIRTAMTHPSTIWPD